MFDIDHIPVAHRDLDRLAAAFEALGFAVSRTCLYDSPDEPTGPWTCRSVFLDHGWLDLQRGPERPASSGAAPHACLFRVPSLAAAAGELAPFRTGPAIRLSRRCADEDAPDLHLAWMSVRERISPFVLALVEYPGAGPADGVERPAHANSAFRVLGLTFAGAEPGPAADAAGAHLDLSGFRYLSADAFESRFGGATCALRFQVRSLDRAARALDRGRLAYSRESGSVAVPAKGDLVCGVEFVVDRLG